MTDKKEKLRDIAIVLGVFFALPIFTGIIAYSLNDQVYETTNRVLTNLPGRIGSFFDREGEEQEREKIKEELADYYIEFENEQLADKLIMLRGEDRELYRDLRERLGRRNLGKVTEVEEIINRRDQSEDMLTELLLEAQEEKERRLNELVTNYSSLSKYELLLEVDEKLRNRELSAEEQGYMVNNLDIQDASAIYQYLDLSPSIQQEITDERREAIGRYSREQEREEERLQALARSYNQSDSRNLWSRLGPEGLYNFEELGGIFYHLNIDKAGGVLAEINDHNFSHQLYQEVQNYQTLQRLKSESPQVALRNQNFLTADIEAVKEVHLRWRQRVEELIDSYENLDNPSLVNQVNQMLQRQNEVIKSENIQGLTLKFTHGDVLIELMESMDAQRKAVVINGLEEEQSQQLTRIFLDGE